jgi:hypothetical protein
MYIQILYLMIKKYNACDSFMDIVPQCKKKTYDVVCFSCLYHMLSTLMTIEHEGKCSVILVKGTFSRKVLTLV